MRPMQSSSALFFGLLVGVTAAGVSAQATRVIILVPSDAPPELRQAIDEAATTRGLTVVSTRDVDAMLAFAPEGQTLADRLAPLASEPILALETLRAGDVVNVRLRLLQGSEVNQRLGQAPAGELSSAVATMTGELLRAAGLGASAAPTSPVVPAAASDSGLAPDPVVAPGPAGLVAAPVEPTPAPASPTDSPSSALVAPAAAVALATPADDPGSSATQPAAEAYAGPDGRLRGRGALSFMAGTERWGLGVSLRGELALSGWDGGSFDLGFEGGFATDGGGDLETKTIPIGAYLSLRFAFGPIELGPRLGLSAAFELFTLSLPATNELSDTDLVVRPILGAHFSGRWGRVGFLVAVDGYLGEGNPVVFSAGLVF